jgi:hypothetical protein
MRCALTVLVLEALSGCATVWTDRYDPADVSHRRTAELCREGVADEQEFARCMEELLPPSL